MDHEFGSSALFDGAVEDPCKLADDDLVSCFGWAVGEATPSSSPGVGAPFGGGGGVQCPPGPHGAQRNVDEVQAQLMAAHHRIVLARVRERQVRVEEDERRAGPNELERALLHYPGAPVIIVPRGEARRRRQYGSAHEHRAPVDLAVGARAHVQKVAMRLRELHPEGHVAWLSTPEFLKHFHSP